MGQANGVVGQVRGAHSMSLDITGVPVVVSYDLRGPEGQKPTVVLMTADIGGVSILTWDMSSTLVPIIEAELE